VSNRGSTQEGGNGSATRKKCWSPRWIERLTLFGAEEQKRTYLPPMAKLFASEVAMEIALNAVRALGGYGYSTEYDVVGRDGI
jgi:alkylation response protein AidB-like acyl-CoA dehydrogenase